MADSIIRRGRDTHVNSGDPDQSYPQAKYPRVTSGSHKIFVHLPLPGVRKKTIESATLSVPVRGSWAAQTLTATPVDEQWTPRTTTWNDQPAAAGGAVSDAQGAKTDGQRVEIDVTAHVQAVADGAKHYGWQITTGSAAENRVYGFDAPGNNSWKLEVNYVEAPEPPSDLAPNGTLVAVEPMLTFDFVDLGGESTEQAALNVQVNTSATAVGAWDSGEVAATLPQYDLAAAAWTGVDGTDYFWRVKVKDGAGYWSDWSDWATFTYDVKPTLTIDQPTGGVIWDPSPTILASIDSGVIVAYRVRIARGDDKTRIVYDSRKRPGSGTDELAHTVPFKQDGKRVLRDDADYWLNVRIWDNNDREATPGDPTYTQVWTQFHLDDDIVPTAPEDLIAVQIGDTPRVRLTWARTGTADGWVVVRDGEIIARLDVDEVESESGIYSWVDSGAAPLVEHIYVVKAIDNGTSKQTTPSAPATCTTQVAGVWLLGEDEGDEVRLKGVEVGGFRTLDRRASYKPLNLAYDIDVVHAFEGVVGHFEGGIDLSPGYEWDTARARLLAYKQASEQEVQLVYGTTNVPVRLRNLSVTPAVGLLPHNMRHDVAFDAQQTSDFEVEV